MYLRHDCLAAKLLGNNVKAQFKADQHTPIQSKGIHHEAIWSRIFWHVLASVRRLRERGIGGGFSGLRNWICRCFTGFWFDGADDGVRDWAYLGLPFKSCCFDRTVGGWALSSI